MQCAKRQHSICHTRSSHCRAHCLTNSVRCCAPKRALSRHTWPSPPSYRDTNFCVATPRLSHLYRDRRPSLRRCSARLGARRPCALVSRYRAHTPASHARLSCLVMPGSHLVATQGKPITTLGLEALSRQRVQNGQKPILVPLHCSFFFSFF